MVVSAFPYRKTTGPQSTGIVGIHPKLLGQPATRGYIAECGGHITAPVLHTITEISDKFPMGSDKFLERSDVSHIDVWTTFCGCRIPRGQANKVTPKYDLINPFGRMNVDSGILDIYHALEDHDIIDSLPAKAEDAKSADQILIDAVVRWHSYTVLWDSVHKNEYAKLGNIKPWIVDELMMLGLGRLEVHATGKRGRPARIIKPTSWGIRLVELCDGLGEQYAIPRHLRDGTRNIPLPGSKQRTSTVDKIVLPYSYQARGMGRTGL